MAIFIDQFELGPMQNYIYFIGDRQTKNLVIVDPAWDVPSILERVHQNEYKPIAIFITHRHHDHTNGVLDLLDVYDIPVYVSKYEIDLPFDLKGSLKTVSDNEEFSSLSETIRFIHTPGHTPGSHTFMVGDCLVAGDTLFIDGCGRCDLTEGDPTIMYYTIYNKLMKLPDETIIYPGHNYHHLKYDTLSNQKKTNPYMQFKDIKDFINFRMR